MGDGTGIQWTDATWNPIRGCSRVSAGCEHCYAEQVARRFSGPGQPYEGLVRISGLSGQAKAQWNGKIKLVPEHLGDPLRWRRPRKVFVNSMSDLFHEGVPFEYIAAVFGVMAASPRHTFQVLTKRPERAAEFFAWMNRAADRAREVFPHDSLMWRLAAVARSAASRHGVSWSRRHGAGGGEFWPLPNVWLGVSVEDQASADARIPTLLTLPAAVRWVSYEPAIGPVDFAYTCFNGADSLGTMPGVDWIVIGGESGPGARPFDLAWARSTLAQCREAGVPVFVKQLGTVPVATTTLENVALARLRDRKGGDPSEWPDELVVREFPQVRS